MERDTRSSLFQALAAISLMAGAAAAQAAGPVGRLVVFGDSNVDSGGLFSLTQQHYPAPPRWQGRDSNGPVVSEYVAELLGAQLYSHAVGGATTGTHNVVSASYPQYSRLNGTGLTWQLDEFGQAGGRLVGHEVALLWIGSNDLVGAQRANRSDLDRRIAAARANIELALERLYALGARRIVVATRTPRMTLGSDDDLNGVDLNVAIKAAAVAVKQRTAADIRLYDAYAAIADMIRNPSNYGFTQVSQQCIAVPACVNDVYGDGQAVGETFVHWDSAHKTTRVHRLMAEQLVDLLSRCSGASSTGPARPPWVGYACTAALPD
ncbi:SGNH/GDSL hydrolase family protein [Caldimonas brevitalea]|uniref:Phospholipase/lecithinase/hemolysin n=1 Tax=Caldimonas brevitalea TaxID=413882 RepID=A0A0G3BQZ0_9BURK|nr:SGNH/GDSL hydrolase family protein [Caldimonas brevitalea]AKJ30413.1 phospholipase/lecithinase/hemolysin [Caldimonas brevitalea]